LGLVDAFKILWKFKKGHSVVFSTGGFVSVPVVIAAKLQGKKVLYMSKLLGWDWRNKICSFLPIIFISFEDSFKYFNEAKTFFSGYPLRDECYSNEINPVIINGRRLNESEKPILFVTGGGNGAQLINNLIEKNFEYLISRYVIVHQVEKFY